MFSAALENSDTTTNRQLAITLHNLNGANFTLVIFLPSLERKHFTADFAYMQRDRSLSLFQIVWVPDSENFPVKFIPLIAQPRYSSV